MSRSKIKECSISWFPLVDEGLISTMRTSSYGLKPGKKLNVNNIVIFRTYGVGSGTLIHFTSGANKFCKNSTFNVTKTIRHDLCLYYSLRFNTISNKVILLSKSPRLKLRDTIVKIMVTKMHADSYQYLKRSFSDNKIILQFRHKQR